MSSLPMSGRDVQPQDALEVWEALAEASRLGHGEYKASYGSGGQAMWESYHYECRACARMVVIATIYLEYPAHPMNLSVTDVVCKATEASQ